MMSSVWRFALLWLLFLLTACMASNFPQLVAAADQLASQAGLIRSDIKGGPFTLVSYSKLTAADSTVSVYIEGDGRAWVNRRPSLNPTPTNPMALKLAAADNRSANIVYLARPCQFIATASDPACDARYWTIERYSTTIVDSYNAALDQIKKSHPSAQLKLFGYSGGGAMAVLIAATRSDVVAITTIAANLDVEAFTALHKVSPLRGSLNPLDFTAAVYAIPQRHYFGADDNVVPISSVTRFRQSFTSEHCATFEELAGITHHQGWLAHWPGLLAGSDGCKD